MAAKQPHLLTLLDWTSQDIQSVLSLAAECKKDRFSFQSLKNKTLAIYFEKPSLRTITTFLVGVQQLGGSSVQLDPGSIGLGKRESVADVSACLARWLDGLIIRCFDQALVEGLATHTNKPVINALTDDFHPCQALAFGQTLQEHWNGELAGKRLAFVGDGNNVATSHAILCANLGMDFTLACPEDYNFKKNMIHSLEELFAAKGCDFEIVHDAKAGVEKAHVLYADVWASMGQEDEQEERSKIFAPFQVNSDLMKVAPKGALVSHCLPAHRGDEITSEVLDSSACVCFDEAENRLHAQKGVLRYLYE